MELETQIMMYINQRLVTGHLSECLAMGFDLDVLRIIRNLDLAALTRCDTRKRSDIIAAIHIDKKALKKLASELQQSTTLEWVIEQLLRRGASASMLKHYFGIIPQEVSDHKKLLALPRSGRGRRTRRITTPVEESLILHQLTGVLEDFNQQDRTTALIQCQALLQVAAQTSNCVNEVWEVAEKHQQRGTFTWHQLAQVAAIR
jgi:hypothetical protein